MRRNLRRGAALAAVLAGLAIAGSALADSSTPPVFVIGDGNAAVGTHVTFWGAQWWKDNDVSGGRAPAAFKGLAESPDFSHCTFSSDPGNSVDPPDTLPPGTVRVLVASSITKSGSAISGTFTAVAVVQPDPGYAGNPGHEGTGTVISRSPACSGSD